jgi:nucleoside 2-deoxyribosyltransferase
MNVIYIAGPFRGKSAWDIEQNIRIAESLSLEVWSKGMAALCPHANTRFFQGSLPDQVWIDGDIELLSRCDAVLMTPWWGTSIGAKGERQWALEHDKPVFYSIEDLEKWNYDERYNDNNEKEKRETPNFPSSV